MPFTVKGSLPRMSELQFLSPSDWREIGREAIDRIRERTARGVGADGVSFGGYLSDTHVEARQAYGKQTSHVDLMFSGDMLNALQVIEVKRNGVVLGWVR